MSLGVCATVLMAAVGAAARGYGPQGCCPGEENMCACRGFAASSFTPEVVVFESASGKKVGEFAEGTCGYADATCDLKWASVCCAVSEEEEEEEQEGFFSPSRGVPSSDADAIESAEEFCARNRFPTKNNNMDRVAYPGKTCGSVVRNAEDLFAQCCCSDSSACCPQGADAESCLATRGLDALAGHLTTTRSLAEMMYSYSYEDATGCPMAGHSADACFDSAGPDADCCASSTPACKGGYSRIFGDMCSSEAYTTCCYDGCVDDPNFSGADSSQTCAWVAADPEARCFSTSDAMGVSAFYKCAVACGQEHCLDSTSWYKAGDSSKDCAWVSGLPSKRCSTKGHDRSLASYACPYACERDQDEIDDQDWHKLGDPSKNCAWVSILPKRCDVKGHDGLFASYACPVACGVDLSYKDSPTWHKTGDPSKDCAWVSLAPNKRCDARGGPNASYAMDACFRACNGAVLE